MRDLLRNSFLRLAGLLVKPSKSIHILNGHYINRLETSNDLNLFEDLIKNLIRSYHFIGFEEACDKILTGYKPSRAEIAFTFDDGFKECYTIIAPVLKRYNISACFFINPSVIESSDNFRLTFLKEKLLLNENKQFMSWDDIKNLHFDGHIIGNHTLNHIALKGISYKDAFDEVNISKSILENHLSYQCKYFAFPYGREKNFDEIGLKAAIECHKLSFTSCNYSNFFFKKNNRILSRRHFEGCWNKRDIDFFLSKRRKYH